MEELTLKVFSGRRSTCSISFCVRSTALLLFLLIGFFVAVGQSLGLECDTERYATDVFPSIDSVMGVKFGENETGGGVNQELLMDVYFPAGDTLTRRPALVLAFGGGFVSGTRGDMAEFCRRFARKGYVTATVDYRLVDVLIFQDSVQAIDLLIRSIHDVKAAIRFMKAEASDTNPFGVDPNQVFVGGVSAGAIAAAHVAYLDSTDDVSDAIREVIAANGGWEGNSNDITEYSSEPAGVVSWSGALNNAGWIDPEDPPLLTVHDDGDTDVPFGSMRLLVGLNVFVTFQGSSLMKAQAAEAGIYAEHIVVPNSNQHVSYFLDPGVVGVDSVIDRSADFMKVVACGNTTPVARQDPLNPLEVRIYPNPARTALGIDVGESTSPIQLTMYNFHGQVVASTRFTQQGLHTLNVSGIAPGNYVLYLNQSGKAPRVFYTAIIGEE